MITSNFIRQEELLLDTATSIGSSIQRREAWAKVTGTARYTDDYIVPGILHAKLVTSKYSHAKIISVDTSEAHRAPGVRAVITGHNLPVLCGTIIEDRPPLATDKVRYYGEPVAIVVADSEREAMAAVKLVRVEYEPLPVVNSPGDALKSGSPIIHEKLGQYRIIENGVTPEPNTNIVDHVKIRKGDMARGWAESDVIVGENFKLPKSDHIAMETRNVRAEIQPDGQVIVTSSTQSPYAVRHMISKTFGIDPGKITVRTPLVGGGFGGKAPEQLEILAVMASKSVNGRLVKLVNSREQDMVTSPCRLGLEARIKLGATRDGLLKAAELTYIVDTGAYADIGPRMAKAIAIDGTGPYYIENIRCDSLCVYTNNPYSTSFRGFGHASYTFCIERTLDKLAHALNMDPMEIRIKNAITPGKTTPTQVKTTSSNIGNLKACLEKLKEKINWDEGARIDLGNNLIRVKGISSFWKTSTAPTNAVSSVLLTFNPDGSINLNSGVVEIGPGTKSSLAQILAEKMKMDVNRIHVKLDVDTQVSPEHWKTVASMTTYMAGRATLKAAEDLVMQYAPLDLYVPSDFMII